MKKILAKIAVWLCEDEIASILGDLAYKEEIEKAFTEGYDESNYEEYFIDKLEEAQRPIYEAGIEKGIQIAEKNINY